jgi:hypothetical protein
MPVPWLWDGHLFSSISASPYPMLEYRLDGAEVVNKPAFHQKHFAQL